MRRKYVILTAGIALLVLSAIAWKVSNSRTFQFFGEIVPRVETSQKVVALTFDDGPTPAATAQLLPLLRQHGARATFFVIGSELEQHLEAGRQIVEAGHELGNHSYTHQRMVLKTPAFIRDEIERTDQAIRAAGYAGEICFRPPYGKKLFLLPAYLSKTGRKTIMCDVEPDSYADVAEDADKIVAHVLERARPGSIILLHVMYESRDASLRAVPGILDGLKARGYEFKTVSELLAMRASS